LAAEEVQLALAETLHLVMYLQAAEEEEEQETKELLSGATVALLVVLLVHLLLQTLVFQGKVTLEDLELKISLEAAAVVKAEQVEMVVVVLEAQVGLAQLVQYLDLL
jgi:hypothetical protein